MVLGEKELEIKTHCWLRYRDAIEKTYLEENCTTANKSHPFWLQKFLSAQFQLDNCILLITINTSNVNIILSQ